MANTNDGENDAQTPPAVGVYGQTTPDGSPDLVAWVRTTLESPEGPPSLEPSPSGEPAQIAAQVAAGDENKVEKQSEPSERRLIYVDYSTPAVLSYSETVTIHPSLREAITAWLALPNDTKKSAFITTTENCETRYQGWDIYKVWGRWDT